MAESVVIAVGADHAGVELKDALLRVLAERGHEALDLGTNAKDSVDYPDFGHAVAAKVASGDAKLGLLVCGSGVGMSMAANRHAGVRAVVCSDTFTARMSRMHNDANVLCIGARVVGAGLAEDILGAFLDASFEGGRHERRVAKIDK